MTDNIWNTNLYDEKHSYVFKFGEDVLNMLGPKSGEVILDLGCGTGHLTKMIADAGADVTGIDSSVEMIKEARKKYPSLKFEVMNAADFTFNKKFDAVFSNAVLHWIPEKEKVVSCVYNCLKQDGRFAAEFGGKDNVRNIIKSIKKVLSANRLTENINKINWYFPSIGEHAAILENAGFRVTQAYHFDRDTFMEKGVDITSWLEMFARGIFDGIDSSVKTELFKQVKDDLAATNIRNGEWFADYKRLRIVAVKE